MTVVYSIVLHDTKDDFMEKYAQFTEHLTAQNTVPEFESIAALAKDKDAIHAFFAHEDATYDEYMQPLFLHIAENLDAK